MIGGYFRTNSFYKILKTNIDDQNWSLKRQQAESTKGKEPEKSRSVNKYVEKKETHDLTRLKHKLLLLSACYVI